MSPAQQAHQTLAQESRKGPAKGILQRSQDSSRSVGVVLYSRDVEPNLNSPLRRQLCHAAAQSLGTLTRLCPCQPGGCFRSLGGTLTSAARRKRWTFHCQSLRTCCCNNLRVVHAPCPATFGQPFASSFRLDGNTRSPFEAFGRTSLLE